MTNPLQTRAQVKIDLIPFLNYIAENPALPNKTLTRSAKSFITPQRRQRQRSRLVNSWTVRNTDSIDFASSANQDQLLPTTTCPVAVLVPACGRTRTAV